MEGVSFGPFKRVTLQLYWNNGKENRNYCSRMGYILGLYGEYIRIMERKMETTI